MGSFDPTLVANMSAIERALDRELWIVTASDGIHKAGLVATHVNIASIVTELPRVLIGIAHQHRTWDLIEASGAFALHLLDEDHLDWTLRFGLQSSRDVDKFDGLEHGPGPSGSPILTDAAGWLDCRVEARLETGDRTIYLAEVVAARGVAESRRVLTTKRWFALLGSDVRARLAEQRMNDAAVDAEAIKVWRRDRSRG
jgi:flavin reductase (DIM6/NTAB) family NADH-FMN oxidoreductase RutF